MKSVLALIDILKHSLLSRRILWYTLTYGLIVILISSIAQLYWSYQSELKELENTFVLIEKSHVPGIAASVYALDEEQLNIHMEGVLYSRDVAYLEVVQFSGDQQIVSSIGHSDLSSPLIRTFSLEQANLDGVISRYGMLSVAVDMSKVYQRLWSNGWKFLLMTVAVVGVIAFGVFLFIHFMLTRHLITMARFYDQVSLDHLMKNPMPDYLLKNSATQDELWELCNAFARMRQRIQSELVQRKALEDELKLSNERLIQITENIEAAFWLGDVSDPLAPQVLYVNPAYEQITQRRAVDLYRDSSLWFVDIHAEDRERMEHIFQCFIQGQGELDTEFRIVRPDASVRTLSVKGKQIRDEHGQIVRVAGITNDISERKQAEAAAQAARLEASLMLAEAEQSGMALLSVIEDERSAQLALAESEHRLQLFIQHAPASIAMFDRDMLYLAASHRWLTDYQLTGSDIIGVSHYTACPEIPAHWKQIYQQGIDGDVVQAREDSLKREDGSTQWLRWEVRPWFMADKTVGGIVIFSEDITERKLAQQELLKLVQAVEQSPESIIITGLDAKIEYVNQAFVDISGYSREEVMGRNPRMLHSGQTPPATYRVMWEDLTQGRSWQGELYNHRKDGSLFIEHAVINPIRQSDNTVSHYVAVKQDITEKKEIALELNEHRHHLEALVNQRTEQLAEAQQRAESANRAKGAFLSNMSHEIRTPMNAIVGLTHLMQRGHPEPEQAQKLAKIAAAGKHLLAIINDILDLSKIEAEKMILEQSNFHLDVIFDHVLSLLKEEARKKGISIQIDQNAVPIWLRGDPTRLRQALMNFASNAIKFTENGKVYLRCKKLAEVDDEILVRFEVEDSGIGIRKDKLKGVFEAFEQADVSTTRRYGGTGLGLAITRRLVKLMGGEVGVDSEQGKGSTFWFTARLHRGLGQPSVETSHEVTDSEQVLIKQYAGSRILLVEDNAINREVAVDLMQVVGLNVDTAENGRVGVEKARSNDYALILMDIQMPEMDGLEATRMIHYLHGKSAIPIVSMSANIFEDDRRACEDAGMIDFVAKPVDPEQLYATLLKWLPMPESVATVSPIPTPTPIPVLEEKPPETAKQAKLKQQLFSFDGLDVEIGLHNTRRDLAGLVLQLRQFDDLYAGAGLSFDEHLKQHEVSLARRLVHSIKGASGTLGLVKLQKTTRALELYLSDSTQAEANTSIQQHSEQLTQQLSALHELLSNISAQRVVAENNRQPPQLVTAVLEQLSRLLQSDDASAGLYYQQHEAQLEKHFGARIELLREQIINFDYPQALVTLNAFNAGK